MIVKSIILAVSKNGNFVILSVMIGKRETCEIVLISQEMKSKKLTVVFPAGVKN